jgi:hypothetical protein
LGSLAKTRWLAQGVCYTHHEKLDSTAPRRGTEEAMPVSDDTQAAPGTSASNDPADSQFVTEGEHVQPKRGQERGRMQPASERVSLESDDAGTVNAVQVSMERSGAENIQAQSVSLENSGARSLSAKSATLTNSGTVSLHADTAEISQSSVLLAQGRELRLNQSAVFLAQSESTTIEGSGNAVFLATGDVDASGDVNSTFLFAGNVSAGGDVNVTFNAVSATALGASFAATLFLLRRVFRR